MPSDVRIAGGRSSATCGSSLCAEGVSWRLQPLDGLHVWPQKDMLLIALPNPDQSFTGTLFLPIHRFHGIELQHGNSVFSSETVDGLARMRSFLAEHFRDLPSELVSDISRDVVCNPLGTLETITVGKSLQLQVSLGKLNKLLGTDSWAVGHILLIGDAAHAVVPFLGQGMNAALEDGLCLYQEILSRIRVGNLQEDIRLQLTDCARSVAKSRQPALLELSRLCLEHYSDMSIQAACRRYQLYKRAELFLHWLCPSLYTPLYSMISFGREPYDRCVQNDISQKCFIMCVLIATLLSTCCVVVACKALDMICAAIR